jgi:sugar lactone lactonase YvrE
MGRVALVGLALVCLALAQNPGVITTVAGTGVAGYNGDNLPAVQAQLDLDIGFEFDGELFFDYAHPAVDADGNIYIPDKKNNRVRKVSPNGIITTVAGNGVHGFGGNNGPATQAALDYPTSVAFDSAGNLYIADQHNNRLRKVTPGGTITTLAGAGAFGFFGELSGNGGPAIQAELFFPGGLAFGPDGSLYFSDTWNNQIRRISPAGIITPFAGTGGLDGGHGFAGDGGPAREAVLDFPAGLAFDRNGNLFFADQHNNRIRKISPDGIITTVAGSGPVTEAGGFFSRHRLACSTPRTWR